MTRQGWNPQELRERAVRMHSVKTGTFVAYDPDPAVSIFWAVELRKRPS